MKAVAGELALVPRRDEILLSGRLSRGARLPRARSSRPCRGWAPVRDLAPAPGSGQGSRRRGAALVADGLAGGPVPRPGRGPAAARGARHGARPSLSRGRGDGEAMGRDRVLIVGVSTRALAESAAPGRRRVRDRRRLRRPGPEGARWRTWPCRATSAAPTAPPRRWRSAAGLDGRRPPPTSATWRTIRPRCGAWPGAGRCSGNSPGHPRPGARLPRAARGWWRAPGAACRRASTRPPGPARRAAAGSASRDAAAAGAACADLAAGASLRPDEMVQERLPGVPRLGVLRRRRPTRRAPRLLSGPGRRRGLGGTRLSLLRQPLPAPPCEERAGRSPRRAGPGGDPRLRPGGRQRHRLRPARRRAPWCSS